MGFDRTVFSLNYEMYLVVQLHMRDVFRLGIKQKSWKDFVNRWDLGCHLVVVQRNARTACRCWWLFCTELVYVQVFLLSYLMILSCTIGLVVKYVTVTVKLLGALCSSQGLRWLQQATVRKSHAAWLPECIKVQLLFFEYTWCERQKDSDILQASDILLLFTHFYVKSTFCLALAFPWLF